MKPPRSRGTPHQKPFLAFTLGDPAGLGPWVSVAAALDPAVRGSCRPLLVGDAWVVHRFCSAPSFRVHPIVDLNDYSPRRDVVNVLHVPHPDIRRLVLGRPQKLGGEAAALALRTAIGLALQKKVSGVVTAPVSKESLRLAKVPFPGHTEMLAALSGVSRVEMVMAAGGSSLWDAAGPRPQPLNSEGPSLLEWRLGRSVASRRNSAGLTSAPRMDTAGPLVTVLVTRHIPLKKISSRLSKTGIVSAVRRVDPWLRNVLNLKRKPRWAICGLNPHAGDNGLIGSEEKRLVSPAVKILLARGVAADGPLPADVAWARHAAGEYDAVASLYHDQGMIPLKTLYPKRVVNITVGLPWVRTSPGHGTAFDLSSGRRPYRRADPTATVEAALWALRIARSESL